VYKEINVKLDTSSRDAFSKIVSSIGKNQ